MTLYLGKKQGNELVYAGKVGSRFSQKTSMSVRKQSLSTEGELFYFFLGAGPVFGGLLAPSGGDLQAAETRFFTTVTAPS